MLISFGFNLLFYNTHHTIEEKGKNICKPMDIYTLKLRLYFIFSNYIDILLRYLENVFWGSWDIGYFGFDCLVALRRQTQRKKMVELVELKG